MKQIKNQTGNALATVAIALGIVIVIVGLIASVFVSYSRTGNKLEKEIQAVYENNKQVLAQYAIKIEELAQVPEMYKNDLKEIVEADIKGRYGPNGSSATMQFLKERGLSLDSSMYTKIMNVIEAGRTHFENEQKKLIDVKRTYQTAIDDPVDGFFLRMAGYPKIKLEDYKVVTSERSERIFESGKDEAVKLRK